MLMVIFGAGASFDSVPSDCYAAGMEEGGVHECFKPPVVKDLFANRPNFGEVMDEVPEVRALIMELRGLLAADPDRNLEERVYALLFKRLREMDVPEWMAPIIYHAEGKPWPYLVDMSRQLWDEARHAMLGEAGFKMVQWEVVPRSFHLSYIAHRAGAAHGILGGAAELAPGSCAEWPAAWTIIAAWTPGGASSRTIT